MIFLCYNIKRFKKGRCTDDSFPFKKCGRDRELCLGIS